MSAPNKGLIWLYMLIFVDESDIGFNVDGKRVVYIKDGGAADRMGIEVGDHLYSYDLTPTTESNEIKWEEGSLDTLNSQPAGMTIGIRVRKHNPLATTQEKRRIYVNKQRYEKTKRETGKSLCKRQINLDERLLTWDSSHFKKQKIDKTQEDASIVVASMEQQEEDAQKKQEDAAIVDASMEEQEEDASMEQDASMEEQEEDASMEPQEEQKDTWVIDAILENTPQDQEDDYEEDTLDLTTEQQDDIVKSLNEEITMTQPDQEQEPTENTQADTQADQDSENTQADTQADQDSENTQADTQADQDSEKTQADQVSEKTQADQDSEKTQEDTQADQDSENTQEVNQDSENTQEVNQDSEKKQVDTQEDKSEKTQANTQEGYVSYDEGDVSDSDKDSAMTLCDATSSAVIRFRQAGGKWMAINVRHGWIDILEQNKWVNDDIITFLCTRMAQVIPYDRLCLLSSHFYQTCILENRFHVWKYDQPVVCLPICLDSHWVLVVIISDESKKVLFYFDSLNKKNRVKTPANVVAQYLRSTGIADVKVKAIKVPIQPNDFDCGLHVISHFCSIVAIMDKLENSKLSKIIPKHQFINIMIREDVKIDIQDAFSEALYHKAYWGKYSLEGNDPMWWPCKRISIRLAKQLTRSKRVANKVPVIWFKKEAGDAMWIFPENLRPLNAFTLTEAIEKSSFTQEETDLLNVAYKQATE